MSKGASRLAAVAAAAVLGMAVMAGTAPAADPAATFPKGPYGATQILGTLLSPSTLGVAAGQVIADVTALVLNDGRIRAFVWATGQGVVTAVSSNGTTFTAEGNVFGGDNGFGQTRVFRLADGTYLMLASSGSGIMSARSSDGQHFTKDSGLRLSAAVFGESALTGPGIVKLADGRYRAYFSGLPIPGAGPNPMKVYSAVSSDLVSWTPESGVRLGAGSALSGSAEHPTAVMHADGTVTLFFYRNNPTGLYTATSTDGLTFRDEHKIALPGQVMDGNDPEVFLDGSGRMILYYGVFDHTAGGAIKGAVLGPASQSVVSASAQSSGQPTAPAVTPPPVKTGVTPPPVKAPVPPPPPKAGAKPPAKKRTITCVKGKVTKKVTGTKPMCPAGYKEKK